MDKTALRERLLQCGAIAVGFAAAGEVSPEECLRLERWVDSGANDDMQWMERHVALRKSTESVMPGAKTVISLAFPYTPVQERRLDRPYISRYAYCNDYHITLRKLLEAALQEAGIAHRCRVCVDSAPISERYWAQRAGIGFRGDNDALIVPGAGCEVFLAEILTDIEYQPDEADTRECLHCGACRRACPTGALQPDGTIDCRRCISHLTIEHRGEWTQTESLAAMNTPEGRSTLFGCDACITSCPLNNLTAKGAFPARRDILDFDADRLPASNRAFLRQYAESSLLRAGLKGLLRNARNLAEEDSE